jgi:GR25 family glycosyltransferase involved in LPS biosynthesis
MSHWRAICLAKKKNWKRVIIMEDDAIITRAGLSRFNLGMQEIEDRGLSGPQEGWDLLWLFGQYYETEDGLTFPLTTEKRAAWIKRQMENLHNKTDMVHRLRRSMATVGYGISAACYDQVISEIMSEANGSLPIDDLYGHRLHSKLKSYIMLPCPIGTDLQNTSTIYAADAASAPTSIANNKFTNNLEKDEKTTVLDLLLDQLDNQLSAAITAKNSAYRILNFWNTQIRPHLGGSDLNHDRMDKLVTRLIAYFEEHLDQADVHQFLWNAHDVDRMDFVEKVSDILHVTSYYQEYDALSIRAASSLRKKLIQRGAEASYVDDLDRNAKFAKQRFHKRLTSNPGLAEKIQVCGFQAWVINLDRRPDRLEKFTSQTNALGLTVQRFSAVDGQKLKRTKRLEYLFRNNDFGSNRGALGAALSHLTLWQKLSALDKNNTERTPDAFLIFEDDVQFLEPFSNGRWIQAYERLNLDYPDWDTCFLAFIPSPSVSMADFLPQDVLEKEVTDNAEAAALNIVPLTEEMTWGGFSAYLINRKGAFKMVQFIEKHGIQHGIDYILMRMKHPELSMENYLMVPNPCFAQWVTGKNDGVDTDIQKPQPAW